jgi:hypothetical protein
VVLLLVMVIVYSGLFAPLVNAAPGWTAVTLAVLTTTMSAVWVADPMTAVVTFAPRSVGSLTAAIR